MMFIKWNVPVINENMADKRQISIDKATVGTNLLNTMRAVYELERNP